MKKNRVLNLILLVTTSFLMFCCDDHLNQKVPNNKEKYIEKTSRSELIGKWCFIRMEILREGNFKTDSNKFMIMKEPFLNKDSLILDLKSNGEFFLNDKPIGNWSFGLDSIELIGEREYASLPFHLNVKYKIKKGNFSENWYLSTIFFTSNAIRHHSVKYVIRKCE